MKQSSVWEQQVREVLLDARGQDEPVVLQAPFGCGEEVLKVQLEAARVDRWLDVRVVLPVPSGDDEAVGVLAVGGTFDHLHAGHRVLLMECAMRCRERLVVGLTAEVMLREKRYGEWLEGFEMRAERVREFMKTTREDLCVEIVELHDRFGPALRPDIEGLVVSRETQEGGEMVNEKRCELGLQPLQIICVELVGGKDVAHKLSSTDMRRCIERQHRLLVEWNGLCENLKVEQSIRDRWWDTLKRHYDRSGRLYHDLSHIDSLLQLCREHDSLLQSTDEVRLAIWFHDVFYDPTRRDNEQKSEQLFVEFCKESHLPESTQTNVSTMILSTETHLFLPEMPVDTQYFLDFDLSILSSTPELYQTYQDAIRQEYDHIETPLYIAGRSAVLNKFLARPRIYLTDVLDEAQARRNLQQELTHLNKSS